MIIVCGEISLVCVMVCVFLCVCLCVLCMCGFAGCLLGVRWSCSGGGPRA
jgi:hypothetical protein